VVVVTPGSYDLIVIGCSLGGMRALQAIFSSFPADFVTPVAVVQHRHKNSNEELPRFLRRRTDYSVTDVEDKQPIEPRRVYLAPADYHLLVERGRFSLSTEGPVSYSRPSIDVLFESAADAYRQRLIGVVLTGSNMDGARGAHRIKQQGGVVVVQNPATSEAPQMPQAAISAARVDRILPLERIGPFVVELCRATVPESAKR
jgi:two-component system, chemotaxis family, protein-glutamate methylesterase/glutaminase